MQNLKKKQRFLKIGTVFIICLIVFSFNRWHEEVPVPLFLLILACGVSLGSFIVISVLLREEKNGQNDN